jgi:hypothetical protein
MVGTALPGGDLLPGPEATDHGTAPFADRGRRPWCLASWPIRVEVTPGEVQRADPPETIVSKARPVVQVTDIDAEICALGRPGSQEFAIIRQTMIVLG